MREIWALVVLAVGNDDGTRYLSWGMLGMTVGAACHPQCLDMCSILCWTTSYDLLPFWVLYKEGIFGLYWGNYWGWVGTGNTIVMLLSMPFPPCVTSLLAWCDMMSRCSSILCAMWTALFCRGWNSHRLTFTPWIWSFWRASSIEACMESHPCWSCWHKLRHSWRDLHSRL